MAGIRKRAAEKTNIRKAGIRFMERYTGPKQAHFQPLKEANLFKASLLLMDAK
jgi:hypothetical protein